MRYWLEEWEGLQMESCQRPGEPADCGLSLMDIALSNAEDVDSDFSYTFEDKCCVSSMLPLWGCVRWQDKCIDVA